MQTISFSLGLKKCFRLHCPKSRDGGIYFCKLFVFSVFDRFSEFCPLLNVNFRAIKQGSHYSGKPGKVREKSGNFLSSQGFLYVIVIFHRNHLLACRNSKIFSGADTPGPPKRDGIEEVRKQGQKFKGEPAPWLCE